MKKILLLLPILFIASCDKINQSIIMDGYLDKMSYFPEDSAKIYLNSKDECYECKIGIYDINNELVYEIYTSLYKQSIKTEKPSALGYGYEITTEFKVPNLKSGIYLIENKIPFIIKTNNPVNALILYPSNTSNAYNDNGGNSFYSTYGEVSPVLSFLRPQELPYHRQGKSIEFYKWLTTLNYNFGYLIDYDLDDSTNLDNSNLLIITGHSEYWSRKARINFDNYVNNGNNAMVLSGNTMWWQIRYEDDGSKLIGYKYETDPIEDPLLTTTNWYRDVLEFPIWKSIGADFRYGGYGLGDKDEGWNGYKIINTDSPLFKNCNLSINQIISIPSAEYDGIKVDGYSDDGIPILNQYEQDYYKFELLGYDKGYWYNPTCATFIVFQKTESSGVVLNTSSTDWCNRGFIGKDSSIIKQITINAIELLVEDKMIFSNDNN